VHRVPAIGVWWPARPLGAAFGEVNPFHGMSGRPQPGSIRDLMMKREIAYGVRALGRPDGDGDLVGVGGRESRSQGEGGQVVRCRVQEVREMRRADQVSKHQSVATGEPCTWKLVSTVRRGL
jgi:hypothetical protein